jgi:hypothetical protein
MSLDRLTDVVLLLLGWWFQLRDWIAGHPWQAWLDILIPNWPDSKTAAYMLSALILWGLFKADRARILYRGSSHVDRFGWSIILYDLLFGLLLLWGSFRTLYLSGSDPWWLLIVETTAILVVTLWQWAEVRLADWQRIKRAVDKQPYMPSLVGLPSVDYPPEQDRRRWYRRHEDNELHELVNDPEIAQAIRAILAHRARIQPEALGATEGPGQYTESSEGQNATQRLKSALGRLVGEE